jgi:glycosyltransferase involved in cell wall biosynthesis
LYRDNTIGVIVPAFNEELLIGETLASIPDYVDRIYAVNDASNDRTAELIEEYAGKDPLIVPIHHKRNCGVGAAIVSGYKAAEEENIDIVAVMAGDHQMEPRYLPDLLDPIIDDKADYTKGNRLFNGYYRQNMSRWRTLGNTMLTFLTKVASGYWHIMDPQNGYTAISGRVLARNNLDIIYPRYGYCNHMLVWLNIQGFRVKDVMIPAKYGKERSGIRYSTYIPKLSWLLLKSFFWRMNDKYVLRDFHPLVLFYLTGTILAILGILGGFYSLYYKFVQHGLLFERGILSMNIFVIGILFVFFAMFFDMEVNRIQMSISKEEHYAHHREFLKAINRDAITEKTPIATRADRPITKAASTKTME